MSLVSVLLVASALLGIGVYGALSQQSFVMIMMGLELMVNGALLAGAGLWRWTGAGSPQGQVLLIMALAVMAIEMTLGFAMVVAVYRARQADVTESVADLKG
ncbi:MAG: NADH-quinone oxidoreductase subunit NuoK [Euzebya sp.]